ncbi:hypothetical protein D3C86_2212710 [compost metagenome]
MFRLEGVGGTKSEGNSPPEFRDLYRSQLDPEQFSRKASFIWKPHRFESAAGHSRLAIDQIRNVVDPGRSGGDLL